MVAKQRCRLTRIRSEKLSKKVLVEHLVDVVIFCSDFKQKKFG